MTWICYLSIWRNGLPTLFASAQGIGQHCSCLFVYTRDWWVIFCYVSLQCTHPYASTQWILIALFCLYTSIYTWMVDDTFYFVSLQSAHPYASIQWILIALFVCVCLYRWIVDDICMFYFSAVRPPLRQYTMDSTTPLAILPWMSLQWIAAQQPKGTFTFQLHNTSIRLLIVKPKKKLFFSCNPTLTSFYSKKSLP